MGACLKGYQALYKEFRPWHMWGRGSLISGSSWKMKLLFVDPAFEQAS